MEGLQLNDTVLALLCIQTGLQASASTAKKGTWVEVVGKDLSHDALFTCCQSKETALLGRWPSDPINQASVT